MAQNHYEPTTTNAKLESLSKDELIEIIHELQNRQVTDVTIYTTNDNEEKPSNMLHKRSNTTVNSPEVPEIQMESPDSQSLADDNKDKTKIGELMLAIILNIVHKWMVDIGKYDKED